MPLHIQYMKAQEEARRVLRLIQYIHLQQIVYSQNAIDDSPKAHQIANSLIMLSVQEDRSIQAQYEVAHSNQLQKFDLTVSTHFLHISALYVVNKRKKKKQASTKAFTVNTSFNKAFTFNTSFNKALKFKILNSPK